MVRSILSVRSIALVLLAAMAVMGMSCGAGGFSIPLTDPMDDRPANHGGVEAAPGGVDRASVDGAPMLRQTQLRTAQ